MAHPPLAYRLIAHSLRALLPVAGWWNARLAAGLHGRRESARALVDWHRLNRQNPAPVFHIHAASAGELRHAEPVLARLRKRHPEWRWVITWFSPSAAPFAAELPAELHGYLPWDTTRECGEFIDLVRPRASLISRMDLWPCFAAGAERRGVPLVLIAAQVSARSSRLHPLARPTMQRAYGSVAAAAAVGLEDVERLARLGVPRERIVVAGDPRADQVRELVAAQRPAERWPQLNHGPRPLVAGSTWPQDHAVLLAAFRELRNLEPAARLIIAPHRPTATHLRELAERAAQEGLPTPVPVSQATASDPLVVLDEVGPLAALYGAGCMAYVGGGFGSAGLHSVLEPAAWGLPVLVGPRWTDSREAGLLAVAGGLAPLPETDAAAALADRWRRWLRDQTDRAAAGAAARAVVDAAAGAADRTVMVVESALSGYWPTITPS